MRQRIDNMPRGYPTRQAGILVAQHTQGAALPLSMTAEWIGIRALNINTNTTYMGFTSTVTSATGYAFQSGTELWLPMQASTLTLYFQCDGGSSVVSYVALGF